MQCKYGWVWENATCAAAFGSFYMQQQESVFCYAEGAFLMRYRHQEGLPVPLARAYRTDIMGHDANVVHYKSCNLRLPDPGMSAIDIVGLFATTMNHESLVQTTASPTQAASTPTGAVILHPNGVHPSSTPRDHHLSHEPQFWFYLALAVLLLFLAGAYSGLTVGLLGMDPAQLQVLIAKQESRNLDVPVIQCKSIALVAKVNRHYKFFHAEEICSAIHTSTMLMLLQFRPVGGAPEVDDDDVLSKPKAAATASSSEHVVLAAHHGNFLPLSGTGPRRLRGLSRRSGLRRSYSTQVSNRMQEKSCV